MTLSGEELRRRLAETITWCDLQKLESKPVESEDVKRRRKLGKQAMSLAFAAYQLKAASPFQWVTRGKVKSMQEEASRLRAEARLDEIRPLACQLRTAAWAPSGALGAEPSEAARAAIVEGVCRARAAALEAIGQAAGGARDGRLLLCDPGAHPTNREVGYESKGFFDAGSAPPWDTWVCLDGRWLLSYVPRMLCGVAQSGIDADAGEMLRWAAEGVQADLFGLSGARAAPSQVDAKSRPD